VSDVSAVKRLLPVAAVLGAAALATAAVGDGRVVATQPVLVINGSSGTDTLQNTSTTSLPTEVTQDPSCASGLSFQIAGGNPFTLAGSASKAVQLGCPTGTPGMARCLLHAIDSTSGAALADFLQVCITGTSATLQPSATLVDFTATQVPVGGEASLSLNLHNAGAAAFTRVSLQTSDLDGNFGFALPCNLAAPYCDADIAPVASGGDTTINVLCTPTTPGLHTATLYVATDSSQVLSQAVTLKCDATAAATPVLEVNPASIDVAAAIEVGSGSATSPLHLTNAGSGSLMLTDVRAVDVDTGAAIDWSYVASGHCSGQIPPSCQLGPGDVVDLAVTFDPSAIGTRHASLLVSYHDTADRSKAIPLDGAGGGATLALASTPTSLDFGVVPVGHSSSLDVFLANHGTRPTTAMLSTMPSGPPFALMPATMIAVQPTGTTKVTATCSPTAAGVSTTTITMDAPDAFMSPPVMLTATCEGSTQPLFGTPTALVFGEVRTTAGPVTKTVMLQAATGPQVTLSGQPTLETTNSNIMLGALSSTTTPATFDVTIDPAVEGDLGDQIVVATSDQTIKIPVTGRVVKPDYTVPPGLDIGTFCINQPTTQSSLTLQSTGTATIEIAAPALAAMPSPFELSTTTPASYPTELAPGQSAIVAITPHPQQTRTTLTDTITWTTDDEDAPTATTQLTATFIDSGGAIAPPALDFGKVIVHLGEDNGQRVVIQNCNGSPLMLDAPTIKAPFSIDSPNVPSLLNPNETATFSIGFHPTRLGTFTGTLLISSQQLATPLMVALSGEGAPGNPDVDAGSATPPHPGDSGCGCHTTGVGGTAPVLVVVLLAIVLGRRRIGYAR